MRQSPGRRCCCLLVIMVVVSLGASCRESKSNSDKTNRLEVSGEIYGMGSARSIVCIHMALNRKSVEIQLEFDSAILTLLIVGSPGLYDLLVDRAKAPYVQLSRDPPGELWSSLKSPALSGKVALDPSGAGSVVTDLYDEQGNRVSVRGNWTCRNQTARGAYTFSWDYENRLTSATISGTQTTYTYNPSTGSGQAPTACA
jgi:hypothetical protein